MEDSYLLEMLGISKVFPGVQALDRVDLKVRPGTVHSLMGENGAGKSTLMKTLIGLYQPDAGRILLAGDEVSIQNASIGLSLGISMIHQELSPVPERTVAENIYLGREPRGKAGLVSHRAMSAATQELFDRWQIDINPRTRMKSLSIAQTQMVEIAKAISYDARIIVMDEPTSAITEKEVEHLFTIIRALKREGKSIIYITHKMDEVFQIADEVTVLRDGKHVASHPVTELTRDKLISMMVGRELTNLFPKLDTKIGDVVLDVRHLTRGDVVKDVSFQLRQREILGIAGLMGAGRTEVLETVFGVARADSGEIWIGGRQVVIRQPADAIAAGMGLLTEDRKLTGIMPVLSVRDNMIIAAAQKYSPGGFMQTKEIAEACEGQRRALEIKTPSLRQLVGNLSGGNQQKVLVARWLLTLPDILMIDEPTRGIDVGAKAEIHRLMSLLAQQGKAIIMVSSEMPEIIGMSDRIVVMHEGRVSGVVDRSDATQETIMRLASGADVASTKEMNL